MNKDEAQQYVDLVIERLYDWGIIPEDKYGQMTEAQREDLAARVSDLSKE